MSTATAPSGSNTAAQAAALAAGTAMAGTSKTNWADIRPKAVDVNSALPLAEASNVWKMLYTAWGYGTADEQTKASVRLGVYTYCLANGSGRHDYSGVITLGNGKSIEAAVLSRVCPLGSCRRLLRAYTEESVVALRESGAFHISKEFCAKVEARGINVNYAYACGDWMDNCVNFSAAERLAHDTYGAYAKTRAAHARKDTSYDDKREKEVVNALVGHDYAEAAGQSKATW